MTTSWLGEIYTLYSVSFTLLAAVALMLPKHTDHHGHHAALLAGTSRS